MNEKAQKALKDFLEALGLDLQKLDMEKTPARVADMYEYLFSGVGRHTSEIWGELFHTDNEGIVAVKNIPFYSMCEHHLVPFFGRLSIAYKPRNGMVAGFSKFVSLVELVSHRPQLQERMTEQIAEAVSRDVQAEGVLVVTEAQQLCMTMRGDMAHGTATVTSACRGSFAEDTALYNQAWLLLDWKRSE
ncbi:MAG: GTP cyclohydrolase I [Anaerovibrio sp.]|nr:GTP cyclohydrolase I [Anaerovibrio sp.]